MRRAIYIFQIVVIVGMLVFVPYDKADRATGRFSFKDTRQEFHLVRFFTRGSDNRLSGTTTVEFLLYELFIDPDTSRKTVYNSTDTFSM